MSNWKPEELDHVKAAYRAVYATPDWHCPILDEVQHDDTEYNPEEDTAFEAIWNLAAAYTLSRVVDDVDGLFKNRNFIELKYRLIDQQVKWQNESYERRKL